MLKVIESASKFEGHRGTVVLESSLYGASAIDELQGAAARNLAIEFAVKKGLSTPGYNGSLTTYPVDATGNAISAPDVKPTAWRADVPVSARMV